MPRPCAPTASASIPAATVPSPVSLLSPARGFTLIEVLVVVAIIGILTAVAYPSYVESVRRGHRTEAQAVLLDAAQYLQRFHGAHDRYDRQRDGTAISLPADISQAPRTGTARYAIVLSEVTATRYTLEARPTGPSATDSCGVFILNGLGQRNVRAGSRPVADCWR